jgi:Mce-associated membrane protein
MFNEAADVLLDPSRRREYDASLDGDARQTTTATATPTTTTATAPTGSGAPARAGVAVAPATHTDPAAEKAADKAARKEQRREEREQRRAAAPAPAPASGRFRLVVALLAALALVAVALAAYFTVQVRRDAAVDDARAAAPAAAERAAKAMLAYDYRQLPADRNRASAFLTPTYRKKYLQTFSLLEKNKDGTPGAALQTKTVVTASVEGSAVVDAQSDKVRVLVFVNQVSRKAEGEPQIFQNRVAMTLEKDGNRWLVDDLKSY